METFFLVTGYDRKITSSLFGAVVGMPKAVTAVQLGGAILRMMKDADVCTVEKISEATFAAFYQEEKGRWHGKSAASDGHK